MDLIKSLEKCEAEQMLPETSRENKKAVELIKNQK